MGDFIDRIRAKREMKRNPYSVKINAQDIEAPMFTSNYRFTKPVERTPVVPAPIQDWQKYGFKSQDDMNFWTNRARSWTGGILDSIDKVKQFQRENNLVDDGKVGWRTIEVFNKLRQSNKGRRDESQNGYSNPPDNTVEIFGRSVYMPPSSVEKTSVDNNQTSANNESNNAEYPILSNGWFANTFSSFSDQNLMKVGRDIWNFLTQKKEYKYNSPYNKEQSSNNATGWANAYRSAGRLRNGGIIRRFQDGGQMDDFIMFVAECIGAKDEKSLNEAINQLGEKGINMLKQAYKKGMSPEQVREMLKGGMQSSYMKKGGCIACEMNKGGRLRFTKPELQKANAKANVNQLPVMVNSLKCGGKAKKKLIRKK
jgi:hypothetical protein